MSTEEQATAYLTEAKLTLRSAMAIYDTARTEGGMWAQVVKNGYDAIEQAASAAIAAHNESIPRRHPAKINRFIDLANIDSDLEQSVLYWLRRRSNSQYVDIRGNELNIPHKQFDRRDAEEILEDAETIVEHVQQILQ